MKKIIASLVVFAFLFAATGIAEAQVRHRQHRQNSTTEKVVTALAVTAVVGAAVYGLSKLDDRRYPPEEAIIVNLIVFADHTEIM